MASSHKETLRRAKLLQRDVLVGLTDAERAIVADGEKGRHAEATEREAHAAQLKEKAENCMDTVKVYERCNIQVAECLRQLGQCLRRLQHTRYAQFADLKVCQQRLSLRSKAPEQELTGDMAQHALEEQETCIGEAREHLLSLEGETRRALKMIDELRNELSKDAASQRHVADRCRQTVAVLMCPTAEAPEDNWQPEPRADLQKRADFLLTAARDLIARSSSACRATDERCKAARQKAELLLERRLLDTEKAAKQLREQASEVDYTIAVAERSLARSVKRCMGKENLMKAAQLDRTRQKLDHLCKTRTAIKLHIQDKLKMQTIDASCRKVTSQSASRPATAGRSFSESALRQRPTEEDPRTLPRLDSESGARNRPKSAATYKSGN
ncbi:unnamed protein product [Effrenium voratum]|uniref:Uncharacterized protein n=1 Tax=Effrenium voratum TaxID=2562239 RepID=A0AA36ISZ1_9DINO|nr:unnamed protein product [Effrenium voratum]CAJ1392297.1 unnamed protein product [Effrenium voratum]